MKKITFLLPIYFLAFTSNSFAETKSDETVAIASINGVTITQQEVKHFMSIQSKPVPAERALQEIMNIELLVQDAKNQGMMKDENLLLEIKRTTSGLIASHYLQTHLANLNISDEQLKARYNRDYVENNQGMEYNANHILVKTEDEAKAIIKQLDSGAEFTKLAKELSTGPSGKNGGALGWFKSTDMVAPFSQATMQLNKGQHSTQAVKSQFGFHVIKLNETRSIQAPSFESVSKKLSSAIAADEISKIMNKLHNSATIEFIDNK